MSTIRITSGEYRGRSISTPGGKTHPMGERERLALMNMVAGYLPGAVVLDAYAGSGALGIEALSRGAERVVFIEKSPKAARTIRENLATLELGERASVQEQDAKAFASAEEYDVILVDPPYDRYETDGVTNLAKYLCNDGILVLSHPDIAPEIADLELIKTRKYAGAHLSLYKHKGIDEQHSTAL